MPTTFVELKHGLKHGTPMIGRYDHNKTRDFEDWLKNKEEDVEPTYELLKEQKETLERKHEQEIDTLKKQLKEIKHEEAGLKEVTEIMQEKHEEAEGKQKLLSFS